MSAGDRMPDARRYKAFISYSHRDRRVVRWLHRALEGYRVPPSLVGRETPAGPAPKFLRPIFRDREELSAGHDLAAYVNRVLALSDYLIVVCSPAAATSRWVDQEIVKFKAHHDESRVLAIVVDGEPFASGMSGREAEECFPASLRHRLSKDGQPIGPAEPIAADLRPGGDGRRMAQLKLVAGMLGVDLGLLVRRDELRRRRILANVAAGTTVLSVILAGLTVAAVRARDEARAQKAQAEGLIEFLLGDLRKKLEPAGRLDALDSVGARAMAYYAAQAGHGLDADSLGRRARVLHMIGDLRDKRGDLGGALRIFQSASASTGELLKRTPNDPQRIFDHAQSVYWVGYIAWRRGERDEAVRAFTRYKELADRLAAIDRRNDDWLAEVGYANSNLGTVLLEEGQARAARDAFQRALDISRELSQRAPADVGRAIDLGTSFAWIADAEAGEEPAAAMRNRRLERSLYQRLLAEAPSNRAAARAMIVNRTAVSRLLQAGRDVAGARAELTEAASEGEALIAAEPDDLSYRASLATAYNTLARLELAAGQLKPARRAAKRAMALAEALVAKDATVTGWQGVQLGAARLLEIEIAAAGAADQAARRQALEPAVAEADRLAGLSLKSPADVALASLAVEAQLLRGDYQALGGRRDLAQADWRSSLAALQRIPAGAPMASEARWSDLVRAAKDRLGGASAGA
jgi:tetratricopeptide (TPR) repeat protein